MTLQRRRDLDQKRAEMLVSFLLPESLHQVDAKAQEAGAGVVRTGGLQRESVGE